MLSNLFLTVQRSERHVNIFLKNSLHLPHNASSFTCTNLLSFPFLPMSNSLKRIFVSCFLSLLVHLLTIIKVPGHYIKCLHYQQIRYDLKQGDDKLGPQPLSPLKPLTVHIEFHLLHFCQSSLNTCCFLN